MIIMFSTVIFYLLENSRAPALQPTRIISKHPNNQRLSRLQPNVLALAFPGTATQVLSFVRLNGTPVS